PREPEQERQRREAAEEMRDDDQGLQQQRHGPHPEQPLEDDEAGEHERDDARLLRILAIQPGEHCERDADETERAREIAMEHLAPRLAGVEDRKSTRLNSSHVKISYAVFCLKKKKNNR